MQLNPTRLCISGGLDAMSNNFKPTEASLASQRGKLLEHLKQYGEVTTVTCRDAYGVMSPAARIMELRRAGYEIVTKRCVAYDTSGRRHPCASYVLVGGAPC